MMGLAVSTAAVTALALAYLSVGAHLLARFGHLGPFAAWDRAMACTIAAAFLLAQWEWSRRRRSWRPRP